MKIRDGFILRKMSGSNVKAFNSSLMFNDSGVFIFEKLQKGASQKETAEA